MFESWLTLEKAYLFRITHSNNLPFILRDIVLPLVLKQTFQMPFIYQQGDMISEGVEALVNTVNTEGVMRI